MPRTYFYRVLEDSDKAGKLEQLVAGVAKGDVTTPAYIVSPSSFRQVPGSPFAYWVSERVRRLFSELPPFESEGRTVRVGLQTSDDFRFVRAWWEVAPERIVSGTPETTPQEFRQQTFEKKRWVPFAKGGAFSPYYADLHLVVNWERDGEEIKQFVDPATDRPFSRPQNTDSYFRPGLTWSLRTQGGFSMRNHPAGAVFGHKGPVAFVPMKDAFYYLGVCNSSAFQLLLSLQMAFGSYEVGVIKRTPVPSRIDPALAEKVRSLMELKQRDRMHGETNHMFVTPKLDRPKSLVFGQGIADFTVLQRLVDENVSEIYSIGSEEAESFEAIVPAQTSLDDDVEANVLDGPDGVISDLFSYAVGCSFGRWDVRFATEKRKPFKLPDPFAPLPAVPPGMLRGKSGLPANEEPAGYPMHVQSDGIIVDDPDHPADIVRLVSKVGELLWSEQWNSFEKEWLQELPVRDIREYFRKVNKGGFWYDHIQRYSMSRRKAPIYWYLRSSKGNYGVWLYYHRLTKDTLFHVLAYYVHPKIKDEEQDHNKLRTQLADFSEQSKRKSVERNLDQQEAFLSELRDFREKIERAANLNLEPDLDDGVILNMAPLWELVPWDEPRQYWEALLRGEYPWSSISQQLKRKATVKVHT